MGGFANRPWLQTAAWTIAAIIVALNLKLVFDFIAEWGGQLPLWQNIFLMLPLIGVLSVLVIITAKPFFRPGRRWKSAITTDAGRVAGAIAPPRVRHRGMDDLVFGQTVSSVRHAVEIPVLVVRSYGRNVLSGATMPPI